MKSLLILAVFLCFSSPDAELLTFRKMLYESESSPSMATMFYTVTKKINEQSVPVVRGYKAMAAMMMCKHVSNPVSKLSYFNEGKKELETAVRSDPSNVELRFLRFSTQSNTPAILGYSGDLQSDEKVLRHYLETESGTNDADLYNKISTFMLKKTKPKS